MQQLDPQITAAPVQSGVWTVSGPDIMLDEAPEPEPMPQDSKAPAGKGREEP